MSQVWCPNWYFITENDRYTRFLQWTSVCNLVLTCLATSRESFYPRRDFLSLLWSSMFSVTYRTRNTTFDNCIWLHVNEDKGRSFVVRYLLRDFTPFAHPVVIRWSAPCKVEWRCFRVTLALLVWLFCNGKLIISACDCIVGYSININIINGHNELYFWCNRLFCC